MGNTVNVQEATYSNLIGDPFLEAYWKDPEFDAKQRAFYYVRVLEIPTPRWTTFDAKVFGVKLPTDVPASIQERAYTSPIWYTPFHRRHCVALAGGGHLPRPRRRAHPARD